MKRQEYEGQWARWSGDKTVQAWLLVVEASLRNKQVQIHCLPITVHTANYHRPPLLASQLREPRQCHRVMCTELHGSVHSNRVTRDRGDILVLS